MYKSTIKKASLVRDIVGQWYEPGRQDRCKEWIYRNKVKPLTCISQRTFWRYLDEQHDDQSQPSDCRQLTLFDFVA